MRDTGGKLRYVCAPISQADRAGKLNDNVVTVAIARESRVRLVDRQRHQSSAEGGVIKAANYPKEELSNQAHHSRLVREAGSGTRPGSPRYH